MNQIIRSWESLVFINLGVEDLDQAMEDLDLPLRSNSVSFCTFPLSRLLFSLTVSAFPMSLFLPLICMPELTLLHSVMALLWILYPRDPEGNKSDLDYGLLKIRVYLIFCLSVFFASKEKCQHLKEDLCPPPPRLKQHPIPLAIRS